MPRKKKQLLQHFQARTQHVALRQQEWLAPGDWRFYPIAVRGQFDNAHTILLDNKIFHGQVGYEIYTPFLPADHTPALLVDRGFIAAGLQRDQLPQIKPVEGMQQLNGILNLPPKYVAFGKMQDSPQTHWPLRLEYIDQAQLANLLGYSFSPYVVLLKPQEAAAYPLEWQIVTMTPERHQAYALQWFAFALTLLILFVALNRNRKSSS